MRNRTLRELLSLLDRVVKRKDEARAEVDRLARLIVVSPAFAVRPFDPLHVSLREGYIRLIGAATVYSDSYSGPSLLVLLQYDSDDAHRFHRQMHYGPHNISVLSMFNIADPRLSETWRADAKENSSVHALVASGEEAQAWRNWEGKWKKVLNHNEYTSPLVIAYVRAFHFHNNTLEAVAVVQKFLYRALVEAKLIPFCASHPRPAQIISCDDKLYSVYYSGCVVPYSTPTIHTVDGSYKSMVLETQASFFPPKLHGRWQYLKAQQKCAVETRKYWGEE